MAQTNKEANRLVYVEGISLSNALELSKEYTNIIFLTDDNKKSVESNVSIDDNTDEDLYEANDDWNLGFNIVRNGKKYIPITGIHPLYNSFKVNNVRYKLKIQRGTGLLTLASEKISQHLLYIGKPFTSIEDMTLDELNSYESGELVSGYSIAAKYTVIDTSDSDSESSESKSNTSEKVILYIIQDNNTNRIIGYLYSFDSLAILHTAMYDNHYLGPLSLMNTNYSDNESNYIDGATDGQSLFYYADDDSKVVAYVPQDFANNFQFTTVLYQGDSSDNTHLDTPVVISTSKNGEISIDGSLYNIMQMNADDITAISFIVKD